MAADMPSVKPDACIGEPNTMRKLLTPVAALLLSAAPALAQTASPALSLEFNAAQPTEKGCRLVFVVKNGLGKPLARTGLELALFNAKGEVDRLTVLEFKDLPSDKTKVSRFELSGVQCPDLSRLLVNSVTACEGEGIDANACKGALQLSNKTGVEFGQ